MDITAIVIGGIAVLISCLACVDIGISIERRRIRRVLADTTLFPPRHVIPVTVAECSECDAGLSVYDTFYSDGTVVSKCDACGSHSLNFWHPQDTPKWAAERIGR